MTASKALSTEQLINELQTRGVRLEDAGHGAPAGAAAPAPRTTRRYRSMAGW